MSHCINGYCSNLKLIFVIADNPPPGTAPHMVARLWKISKLEICSHYTGLCPKVLKVCVVAV